jgi:hypothetical protein
MKTGLVNRTVGWSLVSNLHEPGRKIIVLAKTDTRQMEQKRHCMYGVTVSRVRVTTVALEKK